MLRLLWRLFLVATFGSACAWAVSDSRAQSVHALVRGRYVQAVSYRGRVMILDMPEFPAIRGKSWWGYIPAGATEQSRRQIQGIAVFDLYPETERAYGPVAASSGMAQVDLATAQSLAEMTGQPGPAALETAPLAGSIAIIPQSGAPTRMRYSLPSFAYRAWSMPHWVAITALALPAVTAWLWSRRRAGGRPRRDCPRCGYARRWELDW